jgi:hypothetical protein
MPDLDIEALTRGLLDVCRDLDRYLVGLLTPEPTPTAALKHEIAELEGDLATKKYLLDKSRKMIADAEEKFGALKAQQIRSIYNP